MKSDPLCNKPKANFIGAGKLGTTMAHLLFESSCLKIQSVYNRTVEKSITAIEFIGEGEACQDLSKLKPANIYFIATPDDQIESTCQKIISTSQVEPASIFVHFSGVLTSDVLKSAREKGHYTCSLHPTKSFSSPEKTSLNFQDTFCAFEGSEEAYDVLSGMISKIGGKIFHIQKNQKSLYHVGAVFASNYLITVFSCAVQCYKSSGISEEMAKEIVISFMQGTLNNVVNTEKLSSALTGPLQRGDIKTIEKHIKSLKLTPDTQECYRVLGKKTLELTEHDDGIQSILRKVL